jgi:hypothetical protein
MYIGIFCFKCPTSDEEEAAWSTYRPLPAKNVMVKNAYLWIFVESVTSGSSPILFVQGIEPHGKT